MSPTSFHPTRLEKQGGKAAVTAPVTAAPSASSSAPSSRRPLAAALAEEDENEAESMQFELALFPACPRASSSPTLEPDSPILEPTQVEPTQVEPNVEADAMPALMLTDAAVSLTPLP